MYPTMNISTNLHKAFSLLPDPRIRRNRRHSLIDIVILSILAVLSGASSWDSIELFGKTNIDFLRQILTLRHGIPSHDTINRVFSALNPKSFERLFMQWAQGLKENGVLERVVALDGKTLCGSKDTFHHCSPLHLVNAWSVEHGLCLGQLRTETKSNEITAIPRLLELLEIKGCIITIDAMGTQHAIAEQIIKKEADYILAVKGNQQELMEQVQALCSTTAPLSDSATVEKGHGRIETRRCEVFAKTIMVDEDNTWAGLQSILKVTATRERVGQPQKKSTEVRYYISSLGVHEDFNRHIRSHWAVENNLHWVLDMVFREDEQRKREKHAAENFATVQKIALNLLKKNVGKESLRSKRLKAAWSKDFLVELLKA
jgi:predicted transposase YbfD/YdcC